jgi:hypothetical protein
MRSLRTAFCAVLLLVIVSVPVSAQDMKDNFPDRKAIIVNNSPHVELSGFTFQNKYQAPPASTRK